MHVLITGISGAIGRGVARRLVAAGHTVVGIDRRPWPDPPAGVVVYNADIRKRPAEDVFRNERPDAMIHMATVAGVTRNLDDRARINMVGTQRLLECCHEWGVRQVVFVGRHTVYGAAVDAPLYLTEDDPSLGGTTFPELADLIAADLHAASALWRYPEMTTSILRCVYTLGPSRRGTLAGYLAGPRVPMILGFDPLFHFMHEEDVERAIVLALEHNLRGVYNVAGPQPLPLSSLIRRAGRTPVPMPGPLFRVLQGHAGFSSLSANAARHVMFPIVIDGSRFRAATGFEPLHDELNTVDAFRWSDRDA